MTISKSIGFWDWFRGFFYSIGVVDWFKDFLRSLGY